MQTGEKIRISCGDANECLGLSGLSMGLWGLTVLHLTICTCILYAWSEYRSSPALSEKNENLVQGLSHAQDKCCTNLNKDL